MIEEEDKDRNRKSSILHDVNYDVKSIYHQANLDDGDVSDTSSQGEKEDNEDKYDPEYICKRRHKNNLGIFLPYDTIG